MFLSLYEHFQTPERLRSLSTTSLGWAQEQEKSSEWTRVSHWAVQSILIKHQHWLIETTYYIMAKNAVSKIQMLTKSIIKH